MDGLYLLDEQRGLFPFCKARTKPRAAGASFDFLFKCNLVFRAINPFDLSCGCEERQVRQLEWMLSNIADPRLSERTFGPSPECRSSLPAENGCFLCDH